MAAEVMVVLFLELRVCGELRIYVAGRRKSTVSLIWRTVRPMIAELVN